MKVRMYVQNTAWAPRQPAASNDDGFAWRSIVSPDDGLVFLARDHRHFCPGPHRPSL